MSSGLRWTQEQLDEANRRLQGQVLGALTPVGTVKPKRSKYGNVITTDSEGVKHASKKQAKRWSELRALFKAGEISILAREVSIRLPGGVEYRADHIHFSPEALSILSDMNGAGMFVVEDVKSEPTRKDKAYRIKNRQMKECLGLGISEV